MRVPEPARSRLAIGILVTALALLGGIGPRRARANGAFPDSQNILTTTSRPAEIVLVTNFGLVISEDSGQSWLWSCEQVANSLGYLYQYGAPPRSRLYALAGDNLVLSDDGSCGWQVAAGLVTGRAVTDYFPDPGNADRVLAVAFDYDTSTYAVLASGDGGATFDTTIYGGSNRDGISGVEIARSDSRTIYVATSLAATNTPALVRSADGGVTWEVHDLAAALGPGVARIIAVDPADARKVLLLFTGLSQQSLAFTADGGQTVATVLATGGYFTSYARTPAGTILVGGSDSASNPVLYRSGDGGSTFAPTPEPPPHIRALAARDGNVYAATDNFGDGYALGVSTDEGTTWRPVMSYDQMTAIVGCAKATCRALCDQEVSMGLWSANTCTADAPTASPDASADGSSDGGRGVDAGFPDAGPKPAPPRGGSCAVGPGDAGDAGDGPWWALVIIGGLGCHLTRARRTRCTRLRREPSGHLAPGPSPVGLRPPASPASGRG